MLDPMSAQVQRARQPNSPQGTAVSDQERQDLQAAYASLGPDDRARALRDLRVAQDPIADDLAALDRMLSFGAEDISNLLGIVSRAMPGGGS